MDKRIQTILDSATREALEDLLLRDLLLSSLRIEAAPGVDVTHWGPNDATTRADRDRQKQQMLLDLRRAEDAGEIGEIDAAELRRLIKRVLR